MENQRYYVEKPSSILRRPMRNDERSPIWSESVLNTTLYGPQYVIEIYSLLYTIYILYKIDGRFEGVAERVTKLCT